MEMEMEMEMETEMKMFPLHSHSQWCYVVLEVAFPFEFCYRPVYKKKKQRANFGQLSLKREPSRVQTCTRKLL